MAGKIKGITIEIGGNVQPLNKALGEVNTKSKDLQSELKQVERLLKLDPKNTELLAQKQKLLTDSVENTKQKLDTLKEAEKQVQQQFKEGKVSEDQYRNIQREVINTEQSLKKMTDQLDETNNKWKTVGDNLKSTGEKMQDIGGKMTDVGEKMTVGVTLPIVAAGGAILKGAIDAENAQGKLQASLGATKAEAEELGNTAEEVWKNGFGENIGEASDAVVLVKQNLLLAGDALTKATEGAMTIADIFGEDVNGVVATTKTMVDNFGISAQDALDLITVGFQQGGNYSGELLDTLREYSPQFADMGFSADKMLGILISGAQAGAFNLDKVADAVKEFNIRAQDGSDTTAQGFAMIGLNAKDMGSAIAEGGEAGEKAFMATVAALAAMDDPIKQNAAGTALFGTQWEDVRSKVVLAMADGADGVKNFQGATEEATAAMYENNPGQAMESALRNLQSAIGPALLTLADIITNSVAPALKSLADWFSKLSPGAQKIVIVIAGIVAAIGPLIVIIGSLISNVGIIMTVLPALGEAFTALAGPVGIAIGIITALIAIGIALYKNWDEIKAKATEIFGYVKDFIGKAIDSVKGYFNSVIDFVKNNWQGLLLLIVNPFAGAFKLLYDNLDGFRNKVDSIFSAVKNAISGAISTIKGYFNFEWKLPKIKLPHFDIKGKFSLAPPSVPDFSVNWYKTGGIFNTPSIIGVGEAGREAVLPIEKLDGIIASALQKAGSYNRTGTPITVQNMYVRDDDDIKKVAAELNNLQEQADRRKPK
ncbi:phage tail tape measure protein [Aminipila luticellarii]|uniref:Phage tail protein n=1 Tax=Aminipila luticellarii TaxID=2507160 RepID=A0A410PWW7_9FIRM|nr:phage tail tape measure protein [Aminipila luticellarii]QAT43438.1 phage tail protein [Aminipila luticellarii]